jgi:hypothetical protein
MVGTVGCSSPPTVDSSNAPAPDPQLEATAARALREPGTAIGSGPATLAGVTTWTVYLGTGVTVTGTNDAGQVEVAVTWQHDALKATAVSECATARHVACTDAARAIAVDLAAPVPAASVNPTGAHPLLFGLGESAIQTCADDLSDLAKRSQFSGIDTAVCGQGSNFVDVPGQGVIYATDDGADPCFIMDPSETHAASVSGLASTCCDGWEGAHSLPKTGQLIGGSVELICQQHGGG